MLHMISTLLAWLSFGACMVLVAIGIVTVAAWIRQNVYNAKRRREAAERMAMARRESGL